MEKLLEGNDRSPVTAEQSETLQKTTPLNAAWSSGLAIMLVLGSLVGCNDASAPTSVTPMGSSNSAAPVAKEDPSSRWSISKDVNGLDGKAKISVYGHELTIRCAPKLEAFITPPLNNLGHQLETDGDYQQRVRYKLNGGVIHTEYWGIAESFDALFIPARTIHAIAHANSLTYEYQPQYVTPENGHNRPQRALPGSSKGWL